MKVSVMQPLGLRESYCWLNVTEQRSLFVCQHERIRQHPVLQRRCKNNQRCTGPNVCRTPAYMSELLMALIFQGNTVCSVLALTRYWHSPVVGKQQHALACSNTRPLDKLVLL